MYPKPIVVKIPEKPAERARARMIAEVMDTYYEPINWGLGEIQFFGRAKDELAETIIVPSVAHQAAGRSSMV
jgi:glutathione S-transferase/RNA polymerase-associated protein